MASRYGSINNVDTTGASWKTASADGLNTSGVAASHQMAASDLSYVNRYRDKIISQANRHGVEAATVAGIISRETRGGRGAGFNNGWGDNGRAWGLMQIDECHPTRVGGWDSEDHISQGIQIFKDCYSDIERKHLSWTKDQQLKGALAAYNMGASVVDHYDRVDERTTGGDYANDVTARAQYYKKQGY